MSSFNEKIRILLANNDMLQKDLAEKLNYTPDAVYTWVKGKSMPSVETIKAMCSIFAVSLEELLNDDIEIPKYYFLDQYLPYGMEMRPKKYQDSEHIIIDAALPGNAYLHRFQNPHGDNCSAIYVARKEIWWHYREYEPEMLRAWREEFKHDRRPY